MSFERDFLGGRDLSASREAAFRAFFADWETWLAPRGLESLDAEQLGSFMAAKLDDGFHPNTVRKWLVMARAFYGWMYTQGAITADRLLDIRAIRAPAGASRQPRPRPYRPKELRQLRTTLGERWPRLPDEHANRYARRFRDGRLRYVRVRRHAVRLQLEAVIALALDLGLRRAELFELSVNALHPDNAYVVVWRDGREWVGEPRTVPFTVNARRAVAQWLEFRALFAADNPRPWVQLWDAPTAGTPMNRDAFDKLLRTYIGAGWTLKRLRDTCAVRWVAAGLPLEHIRRLLGLASLEATLPYAALAGGTTEDRMQRVEAALDSSRSGLNIVPTRSP